MTEINFLLNDYLTNYGNMAKEIHEGVEEGFSEGYKEGIKQGFIDGVKECLATGFNNIEVKSTEETLKCALETASDESINVSITRAVSRKYRERISPPFKKKMEEACNKAVENIKKADFDLEEVPASELKICVDASVKKIKECIDGAFEGIRKNLPEDLIFGSVFNGLQGGFDNDLEENLQACEKRICKEIDSKINKQGVYC
jgi:flagellar biosynthesis/type III secretory pathway protein FliH